MKITENLHKYISAQVLLLASLCPATKSWNISIFAATTKTDLAPKACDCRWLVPGSHSLSHCTYNTSLRRSPCQNFSQYLWTPANWRPRINMIQGLNVAIACHTFLFYIPYVFFFLASGSTWVTEFHTLALYVCCSLHLPSRSTNYRPTTGNGLARLFFLCMVRLAIFKHAHL